MFIHIIYVPYVFNFPVQVKTSANVKREKNKKEKEEEEDCMPHNFILTK